MAARTLVQAGFKNTVIYEARRRFGGCIDTDYKLAKGRPVERGPEFFHGRTGILHSLAQELDLTLIEAPSEGLHYSDKKLTAQNGLLSSTIDRLRSLARTLLQSGFPDMPVRDFLVRDDARTIIEETRVFTTHTIEQLFRNDFGAEPKKLGIAGIVETDVTGYDANFRVKEGYSELVRRAAEGLDIRLNTPIQSVDWTKRDTILLKSEKQNYAARKVIFALPHGVLKHGDVQVYPPFPDAKQEAIEAIGVGNACKIILLFKRAFWPKNMGFLSTELDTQLWWPALAEHNDDDQSALLTTFIGGRTVRRFEQPKKRSQVREMAADELRQMFPKGTVDEQILSESASSFWGSGRRFSRGAFSYLPAGCDPNAREKLREPIDDRIFFAGEATSTDGGVASVHGAARSGVRAAEEVMKNFR